MEYGIIHYGTAAYHNLSATFPTCSIAVEHPNGYTKRKWSTVLHDLDLTANSESQPEDLFQFVKSSFEKQKGVRLDVEFARGCVASPDGTLPVPPQEASRLYAGRKHMHKRRFDEKPCLAAAGTADYKNVLVAGIFRLLRAAVHGKPFRLRQGDIVLKYRVCVRLYVLCRSP